MSEINIGEIIVDEKVNIGNLELNAVEVTKKEIIKKNVNKTDNTQIKTANSEIDDVIVYGKELMQETREGYNLLNNTLKSQTINGLTVTVNDDKSITIVGTATNATNIVFDNKTSKNLPAGTYTLQGCMTFIESDENHGWWSTNQIKTFTSSPTLTALGFYMYFASGIEVNKTFYPQLVEGSGVKDYEPYGKMPSTDYPSEIETATEVNITVNDATTTFDLPDGEFLGKLGTSENTIKKIDGVWKIEKNIEKIDNYTDEEVTTEYMSTTGELSEGATVYYVLSETEYIILSDKIQEKLNNLELQPGINNIFVKDGYISFSYNEYLSVAYEELLKKIEGGE